MTEEPRPWSWTHACTHSHVCVGVWSTPWHVSLPSVDLLRQCPRKALASVGLGCSYLATLELLTLGAERHARRSNFLSDLARFIKACPLATFLWWWGRGSGCPELLQTRGTCLQTIGAARRRSELPAGARSLFQYLFLTHAFCPQGWTDPNVLVLRCPSETPYK